MGRLRGTTLSCAPGAAAATIRARGRAGVVVFPPRADDARAPFRAGPRGRGPEVVKGELTSVRSSDCDRCFARTGTAEKSVRVYVPCVGLKVSTESGAARQASRRIVAGDCEGCNNSLQS